MKKYRFDRKGAPAANGSTPVYAVWAGGPSLAGILNCPIGESALRRTVYVTAEPDTFFSQPAVCRLFGIRVPGFITSDEDGYTFNPSRA